MPPANPLHVLMIGATGTAGRGTVRALLRAGHRVTCLIRPDAGGDNARALQRAGLPPDVEVRCADVTNAKSIRRDGIRGERFDALVSCLASRTGTPADSWAIDHAAHVQALQAARAAGAERMVLMSAICVQRPRLAFQHAKLAFEQELMGSGLTYSIVRPTALFKSLSGQVKRVQAGKPFLLFGDGTLTACKPISDDDLGDFMASCLDMPERQNRILPIGGPGEAFTPREQGERLFALAGHEPVFRQVPVAMFDVIGSVLSQLGRISQACATKAELARIGRYYATESMLVLDPDTGQYDAAATPSTGTQTLSDFHAALLNGTATLTRGEHSVFSNS